MTTFTKTTKKDEVMAFIKEKLSFPVSVINSIHKESNEYADEHFRFNMSGYDFNGEGSCTIYNQSILNKFAYMGIYDYHQIICLDFYKGQCSFFTKDFNSYQTEEHDFTGLGTREIIYEIFSLTIFSGKQKRRRD